jgi:GAF domain-containing protein
MHGALEVYLHEFTTEILRYFCGAHNTSMSMHEATLVVTDPALSAIQRFEAIEQAASALLVHGTDSIAAMATVASLLYHSLPDVSWCGFYRSVGNRLVVGPYHGKPACIEIPYGRGVCGRAAAERRTIIVPDVEQDPDHIACDPMTRSEIVVPLVKSSEVLGVLDLDSPIAERFTEQDAAFLERIVALMLERTQP